MSGSAAPDPERRVLLLAPVGRDAALAVQVLRHAHIDATDCRDPAALRAALEVGAAALLVAEEVLSPQVRAELAAILLEQPSWSDLPVLVLTARGADSPVAAAALQQLGNVILLERPVRVAALVSALRVALRARERQYQIRRHLEDQEASKRALREADRRKDEFLATLAHELRNPLAPVRNGLHILRGAVEPGAVPQRVLGIMERQVEHMVRLVDDLMEVSRITRGKIELRREALDLAGALRGVVDAAQGQLDTGGQRLVFEGSELALEVWTDPVRMAQVFGNLLSNAIKFTPHGGAIEVSLQREDDQAVVQVRDSGVGITAEMLPRVFDMFAQARPGHRQGQGGLGIGLTLVRTLVEMHGGSVVASSEGEGCGSTFTVRLPLSQGLGIDTRTVAPVAQLSPPVRVLVVDDNHDAADSLATLLESLGATVTVCYTGEEALACVADARPQLILLDIGMPGMDGHELGRRLRALPGFEAVPLVALSGWSQPDDRLRSQAAGFDVHLAKPTSVDALQALLQRASATP